MIDVVDNLKLATDPDRRLSIPFEQWEAQKYNFLDGKFCRYEAVNGIPYEATVEPVPTVPEAESQSIISESVVEALESPSQNTIAEFEKLQEKIKEMGYFKLNKAEKERYQELKVVFAQ